ncbi:hypothetical protein F4778DRAFT_738154 [Xylariomycetidae sp. FL2044]|nr:hypothetical protein F4778DRAFT_738154 [Xylariomycetidae sp. FL2044]
MPFPYRYICDLLQLLEDELRKPKAHPASTKSLIQHWFDQHRSHLLAPGNDASVILSTLLPERRTDRVYSIQTARLESIVGKALLLGASRVKELRRYQTAGLGIDLGDCVQGILTRTPNYVSDNDGVTVEEIDAVLGEIAAGCRFSSPAVQAGRVQTDLKYANNALADLYQRLSARDAKWFTRLVLKSYEPVVLDHHTVFRSYHHLLPQMLKVRDDLTLITAFLRHVEENPDDSARIASYLKPKLGAKVGRQPWFKGRSIKHCVDMARRRVISCEQKLDGEYCQIHINLSKGRHCIQIFSKSGKDSTNDRAGLHGAIRDSLKIGKADCPLTQACILEGELLVYSTKDHKILPFHKIRKHVSRSGSFLGTRDDSQPHAYEHLMIVYYDVLMIDNESLLPCRHSERMRRLTSLITCRTGYAEIVQRQVISLSRQTGPAQLREAFAKCIVNRSEGLVLKPDEPYFDFSGHFQPFSSCNIKLKKEYVQGWGDVGDFAVVGASYDPAKAKSYNIPDLKWTHFFIGCLKDTPRATLGLRQCQFVVVNVVELNETMLRMIMTRYRPVSVPFEQNEAFGLDFSGLGITKPPSVVFPEPMVFDVRCFSFDKAPNSGFLSMRFPMVSKIHFDRSWRDTMTFDDLQEAAKIATEVPEQEDSQEMRDWISALEKADPRGIAVDAMSQATTISELPSSPEVQTRREPVMLTPPRSSAINAAQGTPSPRQCDQTKQRSSAKRRNDHPTGSPASKRARPESQHSTQGSQPKPSHDHYMSSPTSSFTRARRPLGEIEVNVSQNEQAATQKMVPDGDNPCHPKQVEVPAVAEHADAAAPPPREESTETTVPTHPAVEDERIRRVSDGEIQQDTSIATGVQPSSASCQLAGHDCRFRNRSLLLSPCIATYPWVTDNLLKKHGIIEFLVDPSDWHRRTAPPPPPPPPPPSSHAADDHPDPGHRSSPDPTAPNLPAPERATTAPTTTTTSKGGRHRVRKICLVESRREEPTEAFLHKIQQAALQTRKGEREWIAVYDWRILEAVADREAGRRDRDAFDPWRRYFVGLA